MPVHRSVPETLHPEDPWRWRGFHPDAKSYSENEIAAVAVLRRVLSLPLENLKPVSADPPDVSCTLFDHQVGIEVTADVRGELAKMDSILWSIGDRISRALPGVSGTLLVQSGDPDLSLLKSREMDRLALAIARILLPGNLAQTLLAPALKKAGVRHLDRIVFSPLPSDGIRIFIAKSRHRRPDLGELAAMIRRKAAALARWSVSPAERWLLIMSGTFASHVTAEELRDGWTLMPGTGFSRIYCVDLTDGPGKEVAMRLDRVD